MIMLLSFENEKMRYGWMCFSENIGRNLFSLFYSNKKKYFKFMFNKIKFLNK